jgi:hypothetical protein
VGRERRRLVGPDLPFDDRPEVVEIGAIPGGRPRSARADDPDRLVDREPLVLPETALSRAQSGLESVV